MCHFHIFEECAAKFGSNCVKSEMFHVFPIRIQIELQCSNFTVIVSRESLFASRF